MGKKDVKVDQYINKSEEFAKPILSRFRDLVHKACPDVEEEMKWSFPHFMYKGMMCSMASFKAHCAINFWKGSLVFGSGKKSGAMGQFGRIESLSDLPSDKQMLEYIRKAAELNETGTKIARPVRKKEQPVEPPEYLLSALKKNRKALTTFEKFSPSNQREYIEWITEAKTDETREKRLATAIDWMAEGKSRNWKYMK